MWKLEFPKEATQSRLRIHGCTGGGSTILMPGWSGSTIKRPKRGWPTGGSYACADYWRTFARAAGRRLPLLRVGTEEPLL
jgi:hypothetical protein